jgi:hypothetical protein
MGTPAARRVCDYTLRQSPSAKGVLHISNSQAVEYATARLNDIALLTIVKYIQPAQ